MQSGRSVWIKLGIILLLGLLLRAGYGMRAAKSESWQWNIDDYGLLASSIAQDGRYRIPGNDAPSITREPGFPLVLALGFLSLGKSPAAIIFLLCLFNLATIALLWRIGQKSLSPPSAWIAAAAGAAYPYFIYYSVHPYRTALYCFATTLGVWTCWLWIRNPDRRHAALAGLANGMGCLISFTHIAAAAGCAVVAAWRGGPRARKWLWLYGLMWLLAYGWWPLRTYMHYGAFIPSTPWAPANVYIAMIIPPQLKGLPEEGRIAAADATLGKFDQIRKKHPDKAARLISRAALAKIAEQPGLYFKRVLYHAYKMWRWVPYKRNYGHNYKKLFWISLLSEGLLIPLGLWGLWLRRGDDLAWLAGTHIVGLTALHSLSFAVIRHRLPLMVWMLLFASYALSQLPAFRGLIARSTPSR